MNKTAISLLLAVIFLVACSKSNNAPVSPTNSAIAGSWKVDTVTIYFYNGAGQLDSSEIGYPVVGLNDRLYFQFNEDSSWFESLVGGIDTTIVTEGTYSFTSGNSFTLVYPSASPTTKNEPCNIISLTNTSFIFSKQRETEVNGANPGSMKYIFRLIK